MSPSPSGPHPRPCWKARSGTEACPASRCNSTTSDTQSMSFFCGGSKDKKYVDTDGTALDRTARTEIMELRSNIELCILYVM